MCFITKKNGGIIWNIILWTFPRLGIGIEKQKPIVVFQLFAKIFDVSSPRRKGKKPKFQWMFVFVFFCSFSLAKFVYYSFVEGNKEVLCWTFWNNWGFFSFFFPLSPSYFQEIKIERKVTFLSNMLLVL